MHASISAPDLPSQRCLLFMKIHLSCQVAWQLIAWSRCWWSRGFLEKACPLTCSEAAQKQQQRGHGSDRPVGYGLFGCSVEQVRQRLQPDLVAEHAGLFKVTYSDWS